MKYGVLFAETRDHAHRPRRQASRDAMRFLFGTFFDRKMFLSANACLSASLHLFITFVVPM
jgi:hypothetical protein